jgi:predicted metal-dependent phosphoesterase TrpH
MEKLCDLHTHSTFSDGTYTPKEIINKAVKLKLSAIALCDHNTVDGIPSFLSAAKDKPIEAVSGTEFSVDLDGKEIHMLSLFIPNKYLSQVSDLMLDSNKRKEQSNIELIEALRKNGYELNYEEIKSIKEFIHKTDLRLLDEIYVSYGCY